GDSTMGYQDGTQSTFAIYQNPAGNYNYGFRNQLIMGPQDAVWSESGNALSETFWYGYYAVPNFATDATPHVYPYTRNKLSFPVPWVINHYKLDPNRVFGWGRSMGGMGLTTWAIRQNLFAGV